MLEIKDAQELVIDELITAGLLVTPGNAFSPQPEKACPYIRVAYSLMKPADFDKVSEEGKKDRPNPNLCLSEYTNKNSLGNPPIVEQTQLSNCNIGSIETKE